MLFQYFLKILCILLSKENLSFAVLNVFLQVKGYCFCNTEILQIHRDLISHLFTNAEEMIYCIAAHKNHSRKISKIYLFFSKFTGRHPFNMDKCTKIQFQIVFLG